MASDFNKTAGEFLNSPQGKKLTEKKDELARLANTEDGKRVRELISGGDASLVQAFEKGDMEAVTGAISGILKTREGQRLAEQLQRLMK
jgi:hypothetical protein